ncbi:PREDICTED: radial spoke head protein 3 homolog [Gekko japonicus]|uniref:Radial spoke head protein 3 homolog n=1 Tax=Gekko japonicus TaxID=146911 RepID=A0ABM1JM52_GEKJA|nr:PREDICTED: radial spoke head protein 3 homolog [Gekko japonicus]
MENFLQLPPLLPPLAEAPERLDYCSSLCVGLPLNLLRKLQLVQNVAVQVLTAKSVQRHIRPVLCDLHWLPIEFRICFKLSVKEAFPALPDAFTGQAEKEKGAVLRSGLVFIRRDDEPTHYANLMYERRVVRGNTYALHLLPWSGDPDPVELQRQREAHRKALTRKRARDQLQTRTPDPLEGRRHISVQTELYLEELADRIVEVDVECQTDEFLDRPATPLFIPAKSGRDVATQILEGELFDFDIEVKPMLEVLVGKTIEQALLEVMEEEELSNLRAHQYAFHELRRAELAEVQRLEEQERRHREEKNRRKKQQLEFLQKEKETSEKIAARAFAQRYLSDLIPSVFGSLRESGYFFDPVERDIETEYLPWLMDKVEEIVEKRVLGGIMTDSLIRDVMEKRLGAFEPAPPPEEVIHPPGEEVDRTPSIEVVIRTETSDQVEGSAEPEASGQAEGSAQPEASDQAEGSAQQETSDQVEGSAQLEALDQAEGSALPEASDQAKAAEEPETKEAEPQ